MLRLEKNGISYFSSLKGEVLKAFSSWVTLVYHMFGIHREKSFPKQALVIFCDKDLSAHGLRSFLHRVGENNE